LSPLGYFGSPSDLELAGKPAPPIRARAWLNSEPLDWRDLHGKVTLLEFWNAESTLCVQAMAALRRLHESYRSAGLQIISVHTPTSDVDEVRRFAREYRLPFPIVVDEKAGDLGATARAYGVTVFPSIFLVDHAGVVHTVNLANDNGKHFVDTVVAFLKKAGAPDVLPIAPDNEISEELTRTVVDEFRRRAFDAPATGQIHGTVEDGKGWAIAGAKVEATLQLLIRFGGQPSNHYRISGRRYSATTGPDGRFELPGLCKGAYALKYTAEGKAGLQDTTWIAPDLQPVTADAVLDQGDAIEGIVRDESGKPVAGVELLSKERRYSTRDGTLCWEPTPPATVVTDAEGRFRVEKLLTGDYRFELGARGFPRQTLDWVPAGSTSVNAVLNRGAQ
jgi:peroxiredoxin